MQHDRPDDMELQQETYHATTTTASSSAPPFSPVIAQHDQPNTVELQQKTYRTTATPTSHSPCDAPTPSSKLFLSLSPSLTPSTTSPSPNGGRAAWSAVLGGHIVTFFVWGFIVSFGMFQAYYTSPSVSLSSPSNISWIGSLMVFLLMGVYMARRQRHSYCIHEVIKHERCCTNKRRTDLVIAYLG